MENSTAASMVEVLTPIWQRLLNRPALGVEEDFFDLGGDRESASKLFSEIAKACGRDMPPETIFLAPTVATLAALIEGSSAARIPRVVTLKAGGEGPPVFFTAGLGGSLLDLVQLARHVETPHPIYGLVARGVDGLDEPLKRVEDMAQLYLDAVMKTQPQGPYLLIGGSFGGLVMLEMAQRLTENGEKIGLLALLDTYPHIRFLRFLHKVRLFSRRASNRVWATLQLPPGKAVSYVFGRLQDEFPIFGGRGRREGNRLRKEPTLSPLMLRLRDSDFFALGRYRPRFYKGKIRFVRAEVDSYFPDDPAAIWDSLACEFEVDVVPGDHLRMITTHYQGLASVLTRYLQEARP